METLYLKFAYHTDHRLIDEDTAVKWVLDTEGAETSDCGTVKLAHAAELIQDRSVVILLPVEQFYLNAVAVQTKNRKQLEKAIPYTLEDDLTQDVEDLHFSYGKRTDNGEVPVAVISIAHLDHIINVLDSVKIFPDVISADIYGLNHNKDGWSLCIEDGRVLARTSDWNGFACGTKEFNDFMSVTVSELEQAPSRLTVYSHPDEDIENITKLPDTELDDYWSPSVYTRGFSPDSCINLLQGAYAKANKTHKTVRPWKIVAGLAATWVAVAMLHTGIEYQRFNRANNNVTKEINQVFQRTFPDVKKVANARVQMEQRLKKLTSAGAQVSNADFLKYLHQSGYELYKNSDVSILNIQYKNNQLSLEIKANDIQQLEAVKTKLQSKDINAELQTAKTVDNYVLARMMVSE